MHRKMDANDINQPFMATRALTPDDCVESVLSVEIRWLRRQAHDEKYVSISTAGRPQ